MKQYTCPMHPKVVKAKAGKCPDCGMALGAKAAAAAKYTCSMDPDVVANKPGKCPKFGMTLIKNEKRKMMADSTDSKCRITGMMNPKPLINYFNNINML